MNIWDSAQRGFEKASQAAARLARMQRLRSAIDNLSRSMLTQNEKILNTVMDLHIAGKLRQEELIPLCKELVHLQKQVEQAQAEIWQLQHQGQSSSNPGPEGPVAMVPPPAPTETTVTAPNTPPMQPPSGSSYSLSDAETIYVPPPPPPPGYRPLESALPVAAPPPPPDPASLVPSSRETPVTGPVTPPPVQLQTLQCHTCQEPLTPQQTFCARCGTFTAQHTKAHLPTQRASQSGLRYPPDAETVRDKELGGR